jgi:RhtB (resistance to homoserine/threonine) family protein
MMFGIENFLAFVLAGILLNLTPGADTMYILGRSISQGQKAGIYSALGIACGCCIHVMFAAFGLSIIIAQSQLAFNTVKYLGAAYLFYLGVKMLLDKSKSNFTVPELADINHRKIFLSGVITNVLNPKVALFFIAFLPQFVQKDYIHNPVSFLILGLTFTITGAIWSLILAASAARNSKSFKKNPTIDKWLNKATGGIFILLGIKLVFAKSR